MPANMTYNSLIEDIPAYLEQEANAAFLAQLPRLVMLAENRVTVDLRVLGTQKVAASAFVAGDGVIAKPSFWRVNESFNFTHPTEGRVELLLRKYEYCRNYWPNAAATDVPRFYCDYNYKNFLIVPTPVAAYPFELVYQARQDPLDPSNQVNWLTTDAPQLLLQACLAEGQLFLKNFQQYNTMNTIYTASLEAFKGEDANRSVDKSQVP